MEIVAWISTGTMMVATDALDADHPMHPYNQIKNKGERPEDYGYRHPREVEFANKSREELIDEIMSLRVNLRDYMIHC